MLTRREFVAATSALILTAAKHRNARAPITIELNHNRPFIPVALGGPSHRTRQVSCWFDTGGGSFVLTKPVVDALGLAVTGPVESAEGSHYQSIVPPRLYVDDAEIVLAGGSAMMSLDGPTIDPSVASPGFLPGRFLRAHRVLLDYPGKRFGLDQPLDSAAVGLSVQIDAHTAFPRIDVTIDGERQGLLLDSGASCTMLSRTYIDKLAVKHPDWKTVTGAYGPANMRGTRGETDARMIRIPEIDLGGIVLRDVAAVSRPPDTFERWMSNMMSAPIIGALGGNALRNLRLSIDYPRNALGATFVENPVAHEFDMVPLMLQPTFKGYQIAAVMAGAKLSVAREQLAGKALVAVDDELVGTKPIGSVLALLRGEPGSTHRLRIAGASGALTVEATVSRIFSS